MNSTKLIITDIDDTSLACADVLQTWLKDKHNITSNKRLRDHYHIPQTFNIDVNKTISLLEEFYFTQEFGNLPPESCAKEIFPLLYDKGYQFVAITSCISHQDVAVARKANLEKAFGFPWAEVHCTGTNISKLDTLKLYPASIWVDDLLHNSVAGFEAGHESFLIDRPYNKHADHPEIKRVVDWHEINKILENK